MRKIRLNGDYLLHFDISVSLSEQKVLQSKRFSCYA